jgi:type IV fimbrial biogenesis protein FimT
MHTRIHGFTLIEAMIVLAIVSILFGIAVPQFDGLLARNRAAAVHNGLLATFAHARSTAVTLRTNTVVCASADGRRCRGDGIWEHGWISFIDLDGDGVIGMGDQLLRSERGPADGMRVRTSASRSRLRFLRSGSSGGSNLTMRLCAANGVPVQGLIVSNTGRARSANAREVAALQACT